MSRFGRGRRRFDDRMEASWRIVGGVKLVVRQGRVRTFPCEAAGMAQGMREGHLRLDSSRACSPAGSGICPPSQSPWTRQGDWRRWNRALPHREECERCLRRNLWPAVGPWSVNSKAYARRQTCARPTSSGVVAAAVGAAVIGRHMLGPPSRCDGASLVRGAGFPLSRGTSAQAVNPN